VIRGQMLQEMLPLADASKALAVENAPAADSGLLVAAEPADVTVYSNPLSHEKERNSEGNSEGNSNSGKRELQWAPQLTHDTSDLLTHPMCQQQDQLIASNNPFSEGVQLPLICRATLVLVRILHQG
jgi:hypothetical protein